MPRKTLGAMAILLGLAVFVCGLSALPAQTAASAAQPSERPPLFTPTAAVPVASPLPPEATRQPPPTVATIVPFPTTARPRATRTPTATPSATFTSTATQTAIPSSVFETATSEAATAQAATVQAIVALTSTALRLSLLTTTPPAATSLASPTSLPPTESYPQAYPDPSASGATSATSGGGFLLWLVVLIPFIALALALWWLFVRRFPWYPGWGRPRRGSQRAGRRYARRRSFPF